MVLAQVDEFFFVCMCVDVSVHVKLFLPILAPPSLRHHQTHIQIVSIICRCRRTSRISGSRICARINKRMVETTTTHHAREWAAISINHSGAFDISLPLPRCHCQIPNRRHRRPRMRRPVLVYHHMYILHERDIFKRFPCVKDTRR